jgi:glycosyltransferase involved in cell wall biosynthesis
VNQGLPRVCVVASEESALDAQRYPHATRARPGASPPEGALVVFLGPGERLLPDALWRVARAWRRHPGAALYLGNGLLDTSDGRTQPFLSGPPAIDDVFTAAAFVTATGGALEGARTAIASAAARGRAILMADPIAARRVDTLPPRRAAGPGRPHDVVDLPLAAADVPAPARRAGRPSFSVVTPSFNQARFLGAALDSVLLQGVPGVETIVRDGGSTDGSVDVLRAYAARLTTWVSQPDAGPAGAINAGFRAARGDVLCWLASDDLLAEDALASVGEAFAEDPSLDLVYGNALYVDADGQLAAPLHDGVPTSLYFGALQPAERIPLYWTYVHSLPQPAVFFRRRLFDACGPLDESLHHVFDFELFWRFVRHGARARKLERTLAFYRLHAEAKSASWRPFLVELYRSTRGHWPRFGTPAFRVTLAAFVRAYARRRSGDGPQGLAARTLRALAYASALTGIGNPEAFGARR